MPLLFFLLVLPLCQPAIAADGIGYAYREAELSFEALLKDSQKQKDRLNWIVCIERFKSVYTAQPSGAMADDALFMMGRVYAELYKVSSSPCDRQESLDYYYRLVKRFPNSPYRPEANEAIAALRDEKEETTQDDEDESPTSTPVAEEEVVVKAAPVPAIEEKPVEKEEPEPQEDLITQVSNLRFWSNPTYTRVVLDVDTEVPYTHHLLKKDPAINKPQRLYIDLENSRMGPDLQPVVPIGDDLLTDARAGQYTPDTVRVVLDIKSIQDYSVFSLRNPFRIVLDINGIARKRSSKKPFKDEALQPGGDMPTGSLARQLALGVSRIVIDPGHGGRDCGAIGYDKSVIEKNVTLEVSKRLARAIRQRLGCEAILTRDRDVSLSLEERTAIANTKNADIFISIHANAHRNRRVHGVETYLLNLATDNEAIMVAARENATSAKNISDLQAILNELMKNAKVNESSRLASNVQRAIVRKLKAKHRKIKDNGVKQAPFYVLLGAEMPCILVEIAFISNPADCRRLNTASYQEDIVDGIVKGLESYIREISPTVLTLLTQGMHARR